MADLSIVIPARNERWLAQTIADILEHREADTEVIAILDGAWAEPGIPQHPAVTVLYLPESIGQRAATNLGVSLSTAPYVMKCDGHVSFAQGFDRVLIEAAKELGPDVTQIPSQRNLHVFDQVCESCGRRDYQCPPLTACLACGQPVRQELVWKPRGGTLTESWTFTAEPKFQYGGTPHKPTSDIADVMSSLGACFFMSRERFCQLGGLDEAHGSWGSFGIEIACKSWLSGGRQVVNRRTWFAHYFRVGGQGFPYPIKASDQTKAKDYSKNLWFTDSWSGQVKPLRWLVDKFWPIAGWTEAQRDALPRTLGQSAGVKKGIVYYSDNRLDPVIAEASRRSLEASGLPIVAVTLQPIDWPAARNIVLPLERGYLTMFKQILAGLEAIDTDVVFFAEHDVIYTPEHFTFTPPRSECYYYNLSWLKVAAETGKAVTYIAKQTSQLCANRQLLIEHYRKRVARVEVEGFTRAMGFEPGSHGRPERVDDVPSDVWRSTVPNMDIRHQQNLTPSRWRREQFRNQRNCEGWQESQVDLSGVLGAYKTVA